MLQLKIFAQVHGDAVRPAAGGEPPHLPPGQPLRQGQGPHLQISGNSGGKKSFIDKKYFYNPEKYLQAIKEDKKRGVLTEGEYRRSYRKTSQLNDMRFGLSADAR